MSDYIAPEVFASKYTCPHCGAISMQRWQTRGWDLDYDYGQSDNSQVRVGTCDHCKENTLWIMKNLLYPDTGEAPQPNPDMPNTVKAIYVEAAAISAKSPRGAAGLLRLAIQLLCMELDGKGENLNNDIADLVKKGLPERIQKALDIVRVTGNNAVHPGQIDVDDPEVVGHLFTLTNLIVDHMISMPGKIGDLYDSLPDTSREQIEKRDNDS